MKLMLQQKPNNTENQFEQCTKKNNNMVNNNIKGQRIQIEKPQQQAYCVDEESNVKSKLFLLENPHFVTKNRLEGNFV